MSKRSRKQQHKAILARLSEEEAPLRAFHREHFPEEYDFHYDSISEAKQRDKGINPMSEEYQRRVNLRRLSLGVMPYLGSVGIDSTEGLISSWAYCEQQLTKQSEEK